MPAFKLDEIFEDKSQKNKEKDLMMVKDIESNDKPDQLEIIKVGVLSLVLPLFYLYIDGQDWITTFFNSAVLIKDMAIHLPFSFSSIQSVPQVDSNHNYGVFLEDTKDLFYLLSTYLLRHVYIYYGLTKWLIQWDKRLFD